MKSNEGEDMDGGSCDQRRRVERWGVCVLEKEQEPVTLSILVFNIYLNIWPPLRG